MTHPHDDDRNDELTGTRLAVIRHGEAACNAEGYIGGHRSCRGLTALGVAQATALGRRLAATGELDEAAGLFTSVLPRAVQTGAIVAEALGRDVTDARCSLCERHPGEADGLTWEEYEARYATVSFPGVGDDVPFSPGGESWSQFVGRAGGALFDLARRHAGRLVVVVAHGGIVDASLIRFLGLAAHGAGIRFHAENASITEWLHTGACWQLRRYNDAAHLDLDGGGDLRAPAPEWVAALPPTSADPAAPQQA